MKKSNLFSIEEMSVLEALEVKGGAAEMEASQTGCSNNVPGCSCTILVDPGNSVPRDA